MLLDLVCRICIKYLDVKGPQVMHGGKLHGMGRKGSPPLGAGVFRNGSPFGDGDRDRALKWKALHERWGFSENVVSLLIPSDASCDRITSVVIGGW